MTKLFSSWSKTEEGNKQNPNNLTVENHSGDRDGRIKGLQSTLSRAGATATMAKEATGKSIKELKLVRTAAKIAFTKQENHLTRAIKHLTKSEL